MPTPNHEPNVPRAPYQYGARRLSQPLAEGRPLIIHLVLNLEAWRFDSPLPRKLISSPHGTETVPDLPNFSWVEYGMRAGLPRLVEEMESRALPMSVSINATVFDEYPGVGERLGSLGWEFVGHGYRQRALHVEPDEAAVISTTLQRIEQQSGRRPRGWLAPGTQETFETPDYLADLGVDYTLDWSIDDLPTWLRTKNGPLLAIPYSLELNDSALWAAHHFESAELHERVRATLSVLDRELEHSSRILTLGLHPHLIGVPHRFKYLLETLDLLQSREDAVFVTGSQIFDWYSACHPA